jgi:hypothetical protein
MKICIRHRIAMLVLAALSFGTLIPCASYAQSAQDQSATSSSSTTTKPKKKKSSDTSSAAATPAPSTAATAPNPPSTVTASTAGSPAATKPQTAAKATVQAQTPPSPGMVWVNTDTGVYHKPGSRWYGKTKQGKWMTEPDAIKAGYKSSK